MNNEEITSYAAAFVDELTRVGVSDVVISPGSRSTPLAMLMAEHSQIKVWMQMDERSAGFLALGIAKASKQPAALLCTSGTAAAHYLPAVIEAYYSRTPLIVLTADRPPELRDVGAPQAIDQIGLYGKYAKWFAEMALPENTELMLHYIRTVAGRAAAVASAGPAGVVHLNFPFREPLIPNLALPDLWGRGRVKGRQRYVEVKEGCRHLERTQIQMLAEELNEVEKGIIVCGPDDHPQLAKEVTHLASVLQYPVLADPLSQIRSGPHSKEWVIDSYDAFLRNENVKEQLKPEVIIRFGAMPVSKAFLLYVQACPEARQMVIDSDGGWREPTLMTSDMLYTNPVEFCRMFSESAEKRSGPTTWGIQWKKLNAVSQTYILAKGQMNGLFEGQVFLELHSLLPDNATLFVGNSMPIRDLDSFFSVTDKSIRIMANRGANGIDGLVSSALGACISCSPLILVIGDISFFHDLNGLLAAKLYKLDITIILLNNNGGGIFSFLPQAKQEKHFEMLFGTPIGLNFEQAVNMYGGSFTRIADWEEFRTKVRACVVSKGLSVIEVPTERTENADQHRKLWHSLSDLINQSFDNIMNHEE